MREQAGPPNDDERSVGKQPRAVAQRGCSSTQTDDLDGCERCATVGAEPFCCVAGRTREWRTAAGFRLLSHRQFDYGGLWLSGNPVTKGCRRGRVSAALDTGHRPDDPMADENLSGKESTGYDEGELFTTADIREVVREEVSELIEVQTDADSPGIEDIWIAGQPLGKIIESNRKKVTNVESEVREVQSSDENPEGKSGEDMANSLPIQQVTKIWRVGGTIKANKTEHAAALWSDFMDRCKKGAGIFYLDSGKARSVLREHFRDDDSHLGVTSEVERSTIHRAMDALVEMGGELVKKKTMKTGRSALVINRDEFREFCEVIGAVTNDVTGDRADAVTGGS